MQNHLSFIISDECHRIQSELRLTSQKSLIPEVQEELLKLRFNVWSNTDQSLSASTVLHPFQRIITHPRSTDVITSAALSSVLSFIHNDLFNTVEDISLLVECICSCQYQATSDSDSLRLALQVIKCFNSICSEKYSSCLNLSSITLIFQYCEQDIRQLNQTGPHADALTETVSRLALLLMTREDLKCALHEFLYTLFYIADHSYLDCGSIARNVALHALLVASQNSTDEIVHSLVTITCVLFTEQMKSPDGDNFVLTLRLFFSIFSKNWVDYTLPFSRCFGELLDFCGSTSRSQPLRSTAFEIMIDFICQPKFLLNFFANFKDRPYFSALFEKIFKIIFSFANIPTVVPDAQVVALSIISTIIEQLVPSNNDSRRVIDTMDDKKYSEELEELKRMTEFAEKFNQKSSVFIGSSYSAEELAKLVFVSPNISKTSLGEFLGRREDFCKETLKHFIALFDFSQLNIDQSIRLFLSAFRIIGEGQVVDRLMDEFSQAFYNSHPNSNFYDAASVHVLSVGWLMLHTSLHNENVTNKETLPGFISLLKGANNHEDFDSQFLTSLFNSVKRSPIVLEDNVQCESLSYWELLLQKQRVLGMKMQKVDLEEQPATVVRLFRELWQQAASIFTIIFEHTTEGSSLVLNTFSQCAAIAYHYQLHDVLDNLVVNLCRFTHVSSKNRLCEEQAAESLRTLSSVVYEFGAQIQEGWKWFIELLMDLFKLDLLPEEMRTQACLGTKDETLLISHKMFKQISHRNSSVLSFLRIFQENEQDLSSSSEQKDQLLLSEQKGIVKECKFSQIIDQSLKFSPQSLSYLVKSLIMVVQNCRTDLNENAAGAVICVHLVTQVAIVNVERIQSLWSIISEMFASMLSDLQTNRTIILVVQRVLISLFTLLTHMWNQKKLRSDLLALLDRVCSLDEQITSALNNDLLCGFNYFLSYHLSSYVEMFQYQAAYFILVAGIGSVIPSAVEILHSIISKFLELKEQPELDKFAEFWRPLLQVTVLFCVRDGTGPEERIFLYFRDLQSLLSFNNVGSPTPQMWSDIFLKILFPAMNKLPKEIAAQKKQFPNINERAIHMTKTVFKAYLLAFRSLSDLPSFESIWFQLVQSTIMLLPDGSADLKETIPELLNNALMVMKEEGIFESQDKEKMWIDSKTVVDKLIQ